MTNTNTIKPIHIIGGGMAGSEAAWQAAQMGVPVILHEMRPVRKTDAHKTDGLAELVCSNSFRSDDHTSNAVGVLHQEMRLLDSIIIGKGDQHALPAGGALAVDRDNFSQDVTATLENHPLIKAMIADKNEWLLNAIERETWDDEDTKEKRIDWEDINISTSRPTFSNEGTRVFVHKETGIGLEVGYREDDDGLDFNQFL